MTIVLCVFKRKMSRKEEDKKETDKKNVGYGMIVTDESDTIRYDT
jgi:hypothetical protein